MRHIELDDIVTNNEVFMTNVLATFEHVRTTLFWKLDETTFRPTFWVAGVGGMEPVALTSKILVQVNVAMEDVRQVAPDLNQGWAVLLFLARYHNKHLTYAPAEVQHLFDTAGDAP